MTDMLTHEDDELLSTFIDGTLPPGRAAMLKRRLEAEPALAARLKHLEHANAAVRDAYAPIAAEPLPQQVIDLIDAASDTSKPGAGVADLVAHRRIRGLPLAPLPVSLAAGVALAVGLSLGYFLTSRAPAPDAALIASAGVIATGTTLHEILETTASAATREIARGITVTPVLTFRSIDGDYCRQIDIASERGGGEGLACRHDGGWRFEAVSFTAATSTNGEFRPATRSSVIDAAIDERIEGGPLDASAEGAVIERRWAN
jgi:hypothetical protein